MKALILGGYGSFGARLARQLGDLPELELIIAGRSEAKARAFCAGYKGKAAVTPLAVDREEIARALQVVTPNVLIDASGPFQTYGAGGYGVVEACITARVPYLDLADGSAFVAGITAFDEAAKTAGVPVLSGVSSCPALTAAALREIGKEMTVTRVICGIAPTPRAALGLNVLRAVLGYVGAPVAHLVDDERATSPGLVAAKRMTIAPPGHLPLGSTRFALCDVPDLMLLPKAFPNLRTTWFGAGTRPQWMLSLLGVMGRLRVPGLTHLAPLAHKVQPFFERGEHRGGMIVQASGLRDGAPITAEWHLIAEGDDGPYVPTMAVDALLRKWAKGDLSAAGARPAIEELSLADFAPAFAAREISTGIRWQAAEDASLYHRALGPAFEELPPIVQELHMPHGRAVWTGEASVSRGRHPLARLVAFCTGFPPEQSVCPVTVTLTAKDGAEHWQRDFNGRKFQSLQWAGTGRHQHLLMERFGPITVALAITVKAGRLDLVPRHWSIFGIPLPKRLIPQGPCFEREEDGRFQFDVAIRAPLIGLIVHYRGWLRRSD